MKLEKKHSFSRGSAYQIYLQVTLLEPQAVVNASGEVSVSEMPVAPKEGAKMTSANNLEWTVAMPAGNQKVAKFLSLGNF